MFIYDLKAAYLAGAPSPIKENSFLNLAFKNSDLASKKVNSNCCHFLTA